jgi:hypothetical protein
MDARAYRPWSRDWKGQGPKDMEESYIGDVTGVIVGGANPQDLARFPNVVSTEGQLGIPWEQYSDIAVQQHDRLMINGTLCAVTSDRQWTGENVLTGTQPSYYWIAVESTS